MIPTRSVRIMKETIPVEIMDVETTEKKDADEISSASFFKGGFRENRRKNEKMRENKSKSDELFPKAQNTQRYTDNL